MTAGPENERGEGNSLGGGVSRIPFAGKIVAVVTWELHAIVFKLACRISGDFEFHESATSKIAVSTVNGVRRSPSNRVSH